MWKDIDKIFFSALAKSLNTFKKEFDFFNGPFKDMGYAIQRTEAGQYYHWHIDGGSHEFSSRQLVAIFYLNDIKKNQGGTTDFFLPRCIGYTRGRKINIISSILDT